jgi:hypothetical protein
MKHSGGLSFDCGDDTMPVLRKRATGRPDVRAVRRSVSA